MTTPKIAWSPQKSVFTHPKEHNHTTHGLQNFVVVVVQSLSHIQLFVTHGLQHTRHPCPSFSSRAQTHVHWVGMPSNHLILCRPLLLLPSIFPSIRVFSNESALLIRWPKDWSFSISPSSEYSGLISFRTDWFDPLDSKRFSRVFSSTTVWKHQFFSAQPSLWPSSHICTWLLEKFTLAPHSVKDLSQIAFLVIVDFLPEHPPAPWNTFTPTSLFFTLCLQQQISRPGEDWFPVAPINPQQLMKVPSEDSLLPFFSGPFPPTQPSQTLFSQRGFDNIPAPNPFRRLSPNSSAGHTSPSPHTLASRPYLQQLLFSLDAN